MFLKLKNGCSVSAMDLLYGFSVRKTQIKKQPKPNGISDNFVTKTQKDNG